jgi:hypothetical protein
MQVGRESVSFQYRKQQEDYLREAEKMLSGCTLKPS